MSEDKRKKYDWDDIRYRIEVHGVTTGDICRNTGMTRATVLKAVRRGDIPAPPLRPKDTAAVYGERLMGLPGGWGMTGWSRRHKMKTLLLAEGMRYACAICKISEWQGEPITLRLDHIDGNNANWKKENLRLLCPNCDSQQPTYCHRNRK